MRVASILLGLLLIVPAVAQESASHRLEEYVFNAGGHPAGGEILTSDNFRITLDAIGEPSAQSGSNSSSFRLEAGFGAGYPPPGEVRGLRFADKHTLHWNPEKSVGDYNLYRDLVSNLSGLGYGLCEQYDLPEETATDSTTPTVGDGYFYLVTAENRLDEEGSKGTDSSGVERGISDICP